LLIRSAKMATMGQMAAGIVHEIKQPLSAMYGLVQYMVASEPEGEQKEILATIMQSTERLTDIVSRFGSFSQMSAEALQGVAVAEVIERVRRLLVYQLDINRIRFLMDAPEDPPRIMGDFRSLEQVFSNLVINALHALENKPDGDRIIQVKIHASGDRVMVDIEDNGCGIPEHLIKRIFDPFFTTKSPEKGTGLGMAIVESILHKHNAGIQVESRVDAGTKVSVTFPAFRAEETS